MEAFRLDLVEQLTKSEILGLIEILHYTVDAQTKQDFVEILGLVRKSFPFPYVLGGVILAKDVDASYLEGWDVSQTPHWLLNVGYPDVWLQEYFEKNYYQLDPIMITVVTSRGFTKTWAEMNLEGTVDQRVVFDRAASFGMRYGVSASRRDVESQWISFISCAGSDAGEDDRLKPVIGYVLDRLHDSLVVWSRLLDQNGRQKYSPRDREVVHWISGGKTNGEIAQITGMTERTVRYYVARLLRKMDVCNRMQLVSTARELGLLESRS